VPCVLCRARTTTLSTPEMFAFLVFIDNVYNVQTWDVEVKVARTNLPACTWIRAPGLLPPPLAPPHDCYDCLQQWATP